MIGPEGKKAIKSNSKVRIFCLFLAVIFILSQASNVRIVNAAGKIYVDQAKGSNSNSGKSPRSAVKSMDKARRLLKGKGTIYVKVDGEWIELDKKTTGKDKKAKDKTEEQPNVENGLDNAVKEESKVEEPKVEEPKVEVTTVPVAKEEVGAEEALATPAPEVVPEVTPEVTPNVGNGLDHSAEEKSEVTPVVTPAIIPESTPEAKPEVKPEAKPETPPVATPEGRDEATASDDMTAPEADPEVTDEVMDDGSMEVEVDALTRAVGRMTVMVEGPSDVDSVEVAVNAYEALDEVAKSQVPTEVYKRLRTAQIVVNATRMSTGSSPYEIVGNTGDVYENSGNQNSGGSSSSGNNSGNTGGSTGSSSGDSRASVSAKSTGAKTGDNNEIFMLVGIGVLAVVAVGGLVYFKKKKDKDDEDK